MTSRPQRAIEPAPAAAVGPVTTLAIREFDRQASQPARTIRVPLKVFSIAASLVPRPVRAKLEAEGFDLDAIREAAAKVEGPATLVEVEDHEQQRRIVVSLE
jgi:hypothetical protein